MTLPEVIGMDYIKQHWDVGIKGAGKNGEKNIVPSSWPFTCGMLLCGLDLVSEKLRS